jgi:hypothetical protein
MTRPAIAQGYTMDIDAPAVLDALSGYEGAALGEGARLATVDPNYNGTGNPRVIFDGETTVSAKTYEFIGNVPGPGERVVVQPMGDTYVITGTLGGAARFIQTWTQSATGISTATGVSPQIVASIVLPDPGWPYRLMCMATAYWEVEDKGGAPGDGIANRWDMVITIDSATIGTDVSKISVGRWNGFGVSFAAPTGTQIYTGSHTVYMIYRRASSANGKLVFSYGSPVSAMAAFQVPAS